MKAKHIVTSQRVHRSCSRALFTRRPGQALCRAAAGEAQPSYCWSDNCWSDNYSFFAASDQLDEATRRLRIKTNHLAKKGLSAGQAASLAAQKMQLESQDPLAAALQQLQAASAQEDYTEAARLRDETLAWLEGWWLMQPNNPSASARASSSLLNVSRKQYGRWSSRLFTPGDFMHYDLQGSSSSKDSSHVDMDQLLQDPMYGTPLFEVFVLPAAAAVAGSTSAAAAVESDKESKPASSSHTGDNSTSSSIKTLTVALQSAQRAMNEILRITPTRRPSSSSNCPDEPGAPAVRVTNQRIMLLLQPGSSTATAAAVHAGNDQVLWVWSTHLDAAAASTRAADPAAAAAVSGPQRPAEVGSGAFKVKFSLDWHEVDLLRGPGSIQRTGPGSFQFVRHALPADVPLGMCRTSSSSSSSSNGGSSSGGSSEAGLRLFRVQLQYLQPAEEGHTAAAGVSGDSSSSSADTASIGSQAPPDWAVGAAAEVQQLYKSSQQETGHQADDTSKSSCSDQLAALLAAAAAGTAPPGGYVSELQQPVRVSEVALPGSNSSLAAANGEAQQEGVTFKFSKVTDETVNLSFGGWEVPARLHQ